MQANPRLPHQVRNGNSSRFGKWVEVQFDVGGFITASRVTSYLLEKSRVTEHGMVRTPSDCMLIASLITARDGARHGTHSHLAQHASAHDDAAAAAPPSSDRARVSPCMQVLTTTLGSLAVRVLRSRARVPCMQVLITMLGSLAVHVLRSRARVPSD